MIGYSMPILEIYVDTAAQEDLIADYIESLMDCYAGKIEVHIYRNQYHCAGMVHYRVQIVDTVCLNDTGIRLMKAYVTKMRKLRFDLKENK